jgi:hypothetical protein
MVRRNDDKFGLIVGMKGSGLVPIGKTPLILMGDAAQRIVCTTQKEKSISARHQDNPVFLITLQTTV